MKNPIKKKWYRGTPISEPPYLEMAGVARELGQAEATLEAPNANPEVGFPWILHLELEERMVEIL